MNTESQSWESIGPRYSENAAEWRFFLDYRHKFLERYIVAIGAIFAFAKWVLDDKTTQLEEYIWVAPLAAAILSYVAFLIDKRNAAILLLCQRVGRDLELEYPRTLWREYPYEPELKHTKRSWPEFALALIRPVTPKTRNALWKKLGRHFEGQRPGFFGGLSVTFRETVTHTEILSWLYFLASIGFLSLTVYNRWSQLVEAWTRLIN